MHTSFFTFLNQFISSDQTGQFADHQNCLHTSIVIIFLLKFECRPCWSRCISDIMLAYQLFYLFLNQCFSTHQTGQITDHHNCLQTRFVIDFLIRICALTSLIKMHIRYNACIPAFLLIFESILKCRPDWSACRSSKMLAYQHCILFLINYFSADHADLNAYQI